MSTQPPEEQAAFAHKQRLGFPTLLRPGAGARGRLRLPTFRADGADRLERLTLLVRLDREIRAVLYPVPDPARSVDDVLPKLDLQIRIAA